VAGRDDPGRAVHRDGEPIGRRDYAVILLLASDAFEFSWRYQLPALITLPPAGALGIVAVIGYLSGLRSGRTGHVITADTPVEAEQTSTAPGGRI